MTGVGCLERASSCESEPTVRGLTTAANIWLTAAVGVAAGAGLYIMSGITTIAAVALMHFPTRPR